jgi:hypothetical protein
VSKKAKGNQNGESHGKRKTLMGIGNYAIFYGVTQQGTMIRKQSKPETATTRANRSIYTKLGAFDQLRLSRGQGTEVIRKSVLPFSILGPLIFVL